MVTDNSKTHIDPAEYFHHDRPKPPVSFLSKYFYVMCFPLAFSALVYGRNIMNKRPLLSGLNRYAMAIGGGLAFGHFLEHYSQKWAARRDDEMYHYIVSHPQDFPLIERTKYRDVLESWHPNR